MSFALFVSLNSIPLYLYAFVEKYLSKNLKAFFFVLVFLINFYIIVNYSNLNLTDITEYLRRFGTERSYIEVIYYFFGRLIVSDIYDFYYLNTFFILIFTIFARMEKNFELILLAYVLFASTYIFFAGVMNVHRQWTALLFVFLYFFNPKFIYIIFASLIHTSCFILLAIHFYIKIKDTFIRALILLVSFSIMIYFVTNDIKELQDTGADYALLQFFIVFVTYIISSFNIKFGNNKILIDENINSIFLFLMIIMLPLVIYDFNATLERLFLYMLLV